MSLNPLVIEDRNKRSTSHGEGNRTYAHRVYKLPKNMSVVIAGLDVGQALSDDATTEITEAKLIESKDAGGNLVQVTAQIFDAWKD